MRKRKKEQLLSLLQSYEEAHSTLRSFITEGREKEATSLLALCQEGMEKIEGEVRANSIEADRLTALFLQYQEALFRTYQALSIAESGMVFLQKAESVYFQIKDGIEKTAVHSLILFLPYKASMWDSMESIYLAARKDPSCEALVMPISYFERAEGGSFAEDFSIEEERPDLIYIHNPYDDANLVTSVHPRYYSSNLKKYTENLVYIPYFTTMGILNHGDAFRPAFQNVDYIVVQNEEHKMSLPKGVEKKCVILGSPKFDSILSVVTHPPKMPDEWVSIAKGRDLYYYNTSLVGMLENTEAFLEKMEEVFSLFRDHPKHCLLWRPHPLLENTFLTMRKDYQSRFICLKEKFLKEEIGIYDNSPELERAVSLSELYIGDDGTSLISLFSVAEKPVIILENNLSSKSKEGSYRTLLEYFLLRKAREERYFGEDALVYEGRFLLVGQLEEKKLSIKKINLSEWGISEEESNRIPGDEYGEAYFDHGRWILTPKAGNHFLILEKGKPKQRIYLSGFSYKPDAFFESKRVEDYIFCRAENYPNDIRFSLKTLCIEELKGQKIEERQVYHIEEHVLESWDIQFTFPVEELCSGFLPWRRFSYGLREDEAYCLQDFLSDKPLPRPFDKAFSHSKINDIAVNIGTAGEKIHAYFQRIALQDEKIGK